MDAPDLVTILINAHIGGHTPAHMLALVDAALAAAEQRGAAAKLDEVRYIIEYARAQAVGTDNRDMVEACDFVLAPAIRAGEER